MAKISVVTPVYNEELDRDFSGFALMDRQVVDVIASVDDFAPYLRGLVSIMMSVVYASIKMLRWNFQAPGATTTIVLVLFFSGIQLLFLDILVEYIGAIHAQVRRKPSCLIRGKINF